MVVIPGFTANRRVDFNERAQRETKGTLTAAGIVHDVVFGDVADPARFADDLKKAGAYESSSNPR